MAKPQEAHEPLDDDLVSDQELERILAVTQVPELHQSAARDWIKVAALISDGRFSGRRPKRYSRPQRVLLKRIAELSDYLHDCLLQAHDILGPKNLYFYMFATKDPWYLYDSENDNDDEFTYYDLMDRLDNLAEHCRSSLTEPPKKVAAHRPAGSVQYPALTFLVCKLHDAIVKTGHGKLTLSGNGDEATGSLVDTLKILRRPLPEIVPGKLPSYPTLHRMQVAARAARGVCEELQVLFFKHMRILKPAIEAQMNAAAELSKALALAKKDGVPRGKLLLAKKMEKSAEDANSVKAELERQVRVARWVGVELGHAI
jgi:hypothetical protein